MELLDKRVEQKRGIFEFYRRELKDIDEISFMPEIAESRGNRWLTTLTFEKTDPITIIEELERENIESRPLWKPMHLQPLFKDSILFIDGTSDDLYRRGICLPSPTALEFKDLYRVVEVIKRLC
jgi:UDP-N-acetylbacillosamine transaminase